MTDDYLAISNTGKNITITMTPGMKQRILGTHGRIRLRLGVDNRLRAVVLVPCGPGHGYQMIRRKSVWNMSVASKRFPYWPKHERVVLDASQVDMTEHGAIIMLPKPALDMDSMLRNITEKLRRETPPPIHIDHPAMNSPERPEHHNYEHINLGGEYFEVVVNEEDRARFWKAYLRTLEKTEARHLFNVPDMVVAAIAGVAIGVLITLLLAAAGWVK